MVMFDRIRAQDSATLTLRNALERGRVHHAYRFEGPPGVGKELVAFELARALLCEASEASGPCQVCGSCQRVSTISGEEPNVPLHPDVVLVARGLYPPSAIGRDRAETSAISVDQIRSVVLSRAGYRPHEGRAMVVIIRDAEEMTVSAANALLKTLEEPQSGTYFILLTARPKQLLDTIRSRTLPLRFGPLPDQVVEDILAEHGAPRELAALAQGSASVALLLAQPDRMQGRNHFVDSALSAIDAEDLAHGIELFEMRNVSRQELAEQLSFVGQTLAMRARGAVQSDATSALRDATRYFAVLHAVRQLERNAQPTLVLEALIAQLQSYQY